MIVHKEIIQGSASWLQIRAGIPTSSEFHRIVTPKTGKPSEQAKAYMYGLIAERIMGTPLVESVSWFMERGSAMEAEAVSYYAFQRDVEPEPVGFITNDDATIGASPDRLIGDDGLLEIKCPAPHTHIGLLLKEPLDMKYRSQIQGQLWVTGRQWVDIMSYCPGLPEVLIRVERDEEHIARLAIGVTAFSKELETRWQEWKSDNPTTEREGELFSVH